MGAGYYHLAWKLKILSPVPGSSVFLALQAFPHLWIKDSPLWPLTSVRIVIVNMIIKAGVSLSHWEMNNIAAQGHADWSKACIPSALLCCQAAVLGNMPLPVVFKLYKSIFKLRCCFFQQLLTGSLIYKPDHCREPHL